ncbi:glycoprotein G [Psittacid alphaherpesvirus 1]|uniref:Glycoprotein G n=1 Tax=Psittacid herpesvirus 1 (isolate Amazon parrot/-/97-0001/1997) TaxID=670426 RepID=GG_PSHV1|nr:envelope glycoprotein G [Psittacid alphaherpesvirus 1]Q6UDF8.1 RecName: Full=Glycoprotein G; Flags: Precursor [Psittacid herpesvirus 1 Amazon parrot/1997]AAQ73752.1 glycoprotein G [Psittacid alphaherpesvirus 1]
MGHSGENVLCVALLAIYLAAGGAAKPVMPERRGYAPPFTAAPSTLGTVDVTACGGITLPTKVDFRGSGGVQVIVRWFFGAPIDDNTTDLCWVPLHSYQADGCHFPADDDFNISTCCAHGTLFVSPDSDYSSYLTGNGDLRVYPGTMDAGIYAFYVRIGDDHFVGAWDLRVKHSKYCHGDYGMKVQVQSLPESSEERVVATDSDSGSCEDDEKEEKSDCEFPEIAVPQTWSKVCTATWGEHGSRLFVWPACLGTHQESIEGAHTAMPVLYYGSKPIASEQK